MSQPRFEKRKKGVALVNDERIAPFGYVRDGVLRMYNGKDKLELSPEDLRRLADELENLDTQRTFVIGRSSENPAYTRIREL